MNDLDCYLIQWKAIAYLMKVAFDDFAIQLLQWGDVE